MSSEGLKRLDAWRKAEEFALMVYSHAIPALPAEEKWNLSSQLRRSAQSIPANIAEGYGRFYYQEMVRFCYMARGSLDETFSHILLAQDLGYLEPELSGAIILAGDELSRLLNGYIAYLKRSRQGEHEPGSPAQTREPSEPYQTHSEIPVDGEV